MAGFPVNGDQYRTIDGRMTEIKRQLNQKEGSPLDPEKVMLALQRIIEANWGTVPFVPDDWTIEQHTSGNEQIDVSKIALYLDEGQQDGRAIVGNKLRQRLEGKPVLNAYVLDRLLENPSQIPESWKDKYVFFWGTIYRDRLGKLCVRCLCWGDRQWRWSYDWLGSEFGADSPPAVSAE